MCLSLHNFPNFLAYCLHIAANVFNI
jgi:hypothetical protein